MPSIVETNSFGEYLTMYTQKNVIRLITYFVVLLEDNLWKSKINICF